MVILKPICLWCRCMPQQLLRDELGNEMLVFWVNLSAGCCHVKWPLCVSAWHLNSTARLNTTESFKLVHMAQIIPSIFSKPPRITLHSTTRLLLSLTSLLLFSSHVSSVTQLQVAWLLFNVLNHHRVFVPSLVYVSQAETIQAWINPALYPLIRSQDS